MSDSPDIFRARPGRGAGVRRMNRVPLMIVFGIGVLVAGVVGYTVMEKADEAAPAVKVDERKADPATSAGVLDGAPKAGLIAAEQMPAPEQVHAAPASVAGPAPQPRDGYAYTAEWQQYRQQQAQIRQAQVQAASAALSASPAVGEFGRGSTTASVPAFALPPAGSDLDPGLSASIERMAAIAQQEAGAQGATDQNNAKGKRDWLNSPADPANYLAAGRRSPVSPYEVKAGTVIPGVMIGGINSDLPGQIIGQVSQNVWDTATGQHILIPQGARLVGTYDNQVTRGQARVLVAWSRIIYPDGSSVDLSGMPGADQAGYAGFRDRANNHTWKVFGDALLMSMFSAGVQLSQPQASVGQGYDSQQLIAGAIGQQVGQAGMQLTERNLQIQPTLEIRPGYRFSVMVTKDMVLSPWVKS